MEGRKESRLWDWIDKNVTGAGILVVLWIVMVTVSLLVTL